jgi:Mce-associated membrane protein
MSVSVGSDRREARRALRAAERELRSAEADLARSAGTGPTSAVPRWARVALVVVLALAVAAGVAVGRRTAETVYTDSDILMAARDLVTPLLTPDVRDPDRAGRILDDATGGFRDEFAQSSGSWSAVVARLGTQTTGAVDGVALADRRGADASVLVTAVLTTRRADPQGQEGDPRRLRLVVDVAPEDGRWKLAGVGLLP